MSAYVIFQAEILDADQYEQYKTSAAPTVAAAGGRYIVRGGDVVTLEGDGPSGRTVILEFPTMQAALDWYGSDDYAEARKLREGAARARVFVIDGIHGSQTRDMHGARFTNVDLSGARFRDVDLRSAKIVDALLLDADISGLIDGLRVNEVAVAPLVEAELDRRSPERVRLRNVSNVAEMRAAWALIEATWTSTLDRARRLPEAALHEQVDEEWSFVETLRHLVFATDAWIRRTILGEAHPYHALGLPHTAFEDPSALGIDITLEPSLADVVAARVDRMATVRRIVEELTPEELGRTCAQNPAAGYPAETVHKVSDCLKVVLGEEWAHHQYATRDLAVLETRAT